MLAPVPHYLILVDFLQPSTNKDGVLNRTQSPRLTYISVRSAVGLTFEEIAGKCTICHVLTKCLTCRSRATRKNAYSRAKCPRNENKTKKNNWPSWCIVTQNNGVRVFRLNLSRIPVPALMIRLRPDPERVTSPSRADSGIMNRFQ